MPLLEVGFRPMLLSLGAGVLLCVGGCGSSEDVAGMIKRKPATQAPPPVVQESPDADLVAAVLAAGGTAAATLRFEMPERPVPGADFKLRVQVAPTRDVEAVQVAFEPSAGLEILDKTPAFQLGATASGAATDRRLALRAKSDGVFELRATVVTQADKGESATSTFSVPVIVTAPPAAKAGG